MLTIDIYHALRGSADEKYIKEAFITLTILSHINNLHENAESVNAIVAKL